VIDRWPILDLDDKAGRIATVGALGFIWTSFRIEHATGMDRRRHSHHYFTIGNLNLAAYSHDRVGLSLSLREVDQFHQVAGEFGVGDKCCPGLLSDLYCFSNVIAMAVSQENVVDSSEGRLLTGKDE
jgi:hypothetical protein